MRGENKNEREVMGMKRLLALILALSMVFALCACGNSYEADYEIINARRRNQSKPESFLVRAVYIFDGKMFEGTEEEIDAHLMLCDYSYEANYKAGTIQHSFFVYNYDTQKYYLENDDYFGDDVRDQANGRKERNFEDKAVGEFASAWYAHKYLDHDDHNDITELDETASVETPEMRYKYIRVYNEWFASGILTVWSDKEVDAANAYFAK